MTVNCYKVAPLVSAFGAWGKKHRLAFESVHDFFTRAEYLKGWVRFEGPWERTADDVIFRKLTETAFPCGGVLVISDSSYRIGLGAFEVDCSNILEFVSRHKELFGDHFFDTDLIMLSQDECAAWLFHHEGVYIYANETMLRTI
ncbi:hypothetical protein [Chitinimonas sp.]|uniref:hypothetical protein n=1 Tax=Chitinimonas sp. TaxID=1934313 RepID=UPI0035AEF064